MVKELFIVASICLESIHNHLVEEITLSSVFETSSYLRGREVFKIGLIGGMRKIALKMDGIDL